MRSEWHNLSWLPKPPLDFTQQCRAVQPSDGEAVRRLAAFRLDDTQLNRLARLCGAFPDVPTGFEGFRLGIIGNGNSDFLAPALKASALRHGVWLDIHAAGTGQVATAVLDPVGELYRFRPDAVLLALTWQLWPQGPSADALRNLKAEIGVIRDALQQNGSVELIIQTMPKAPFTLFGSLDRRVAGTLRQTVDEFNDWLFESDLPVIDVAALAEMAGLAAWHNSGQWHWAKLPFSQNLIPLYSDYVARYIGALRGRSRKCLVLDLDNTIWGGIIGDDGLEGIDLGQGSPRGEAYLAVQQMALALRARGIILAVCSKNDDDNARLPFTQHPDQVLKEEHIAVFQANWSDKPSNLEAIAKRLDLTPDSLVFLDDDPVEREIVRRELPTVAVPEVPSDDPSVWPQILSAAGYFEAVSFTEADKDRADQYACNVRRESLKVKSRDIGDYLKALEMVMEVTPSAAPARARVAQLINRSNQFNLTTRRYTEEQIANVDSDSGAACFSARLRDRFGDNGIISVIICRDQGQDWYIDTWVMSCRVLGRRIERALLNHIAAAAKAAGKTGLIGHYIPSLKNTMAEKHYEALGFAPTGLGQEGETFWRLDLESFAFADVPVDIVAVDSTHMMA